MKSIFSLTTVLILCFTLGLAPFFPEPHIWGKLKWIAGGATGMQLMDWWDTIMHGTPWIVLLVLILMRVVRKLRPAK